MELSEHLKGQEPGVVELMLKIAEVSKVIQEGFRTKQGLADTKNVYGEIQQELDKWADVVLINELSKCSQLNCLASEEQDHIIEVSNPPSPEGYAITLDPLDGSSLLGVNLTVGTIVGIFKGQVGATNDITSFSPDRMIGAMYVLYGPLQVLVYTLGNGVHEFAMDGNGKFILQLENLRMPKSKIYAPGGLRKDYIPEHARFIDQLEEQGYKVRFSGSFVADVHQILHKGGVFTYPATLGKKDGKLRLLFECLPMSKIAVEAGGAGSDGKRSMLDIIPTDITNRCPVYIGGKEEIELMQGMWG